MPYSHLNDYLTDIRERATRVRLMCFDVDGTLTDGRLYFDTNGGEIKAFHVHDGLGMVMLRKVGIEVAFVTARASSIAERRAEELGVMAHTRVADKLACVGDIAKRLGLDMQQVAFMGDDLPDLRVLRHVGLALAPANAHPWVRERVHWRTAARGGDGAVREICDLLLAAQGYAEQMLDDVMPSGAQA